MTRWIGTSFKMTKSTSEAVAFAGRLKDLQAIGWPGVQPFVLPSVTAIAAVRHALGPGSPVLVGAQNAHWEDSGPWTGEVSVGQIADAGGQLIEVGHSERRQFFAETDRTVNLKVRAIARHGLTALVCVGEPAEVRAGGRATPYVLDQADKALDGVPDGARILLAYEPVWAIGERGREPRADEIDDVVSALQQRFGGRVLATLYGGSVTPANAPGLLAIPGVDGLFVGRSAWHVEGFLTLLALGSGHPAASGTEHRTTPVAVAPRG